MTALLYRAWTKATRSETSTPRYSHNWVFARRAWFKVFGDRVECGNWKIPAEAVRDAVVYESRSWFMPVTILAVSTAEGNWQFGFNPWANVVPHLPFAFRRERIQLRYSKFSVAVRLCLIAYLLYVLWQRLM